VELAFHGEIEEGVDPGPLEDPFIDGVKEKSSFQMVRIPLSNSSTDMDRDLWTELEES
jgi:hypothetical protein